MGHSYHEGGGRFGPTNSLIQMESLLLGGGQKPFAQNFLVRIVRQLQIVDAGVDGGIGTLAGVHLPDHGQAGM